MKTTLISIIVAFLGLSICAASPQKGKGRKPHGGKPHPERPDWEAKKAEFLKKFDKDGDGKISPEEKKAVIEEWKKRIGEKPHGHKRPNGRKQRPNGRHKPQRDEKTRRGQ